MYSDPPLNALRAFESVGRLGSVKLAADELCVTAAAISRHIKTLETHLGITLFLRRNRRLHLTPKGREFHHKIMCGFSSIRTAIHDIRDQENGLTCTIRAPHTVAMRWLLPRLETLHKTSPALEVRLQTSAEPPDFHQENIDAAIIIGNSAPEGLVAHRLMHNEISPVCTPEKAKTIKKLSDLSSHILLHTHARPDDWNAWFNALNLDKNLGLRHLHYESSALAYEAALIGYGIAMGQKSMVQQELETGSLVAPFDRWVDLGDFTYYFIAPPQLFESSIPRFKALASWIRSISL